MRRTARPPACRWSIAALLVAGLSLLACQKNASTREAPQNQPPEVAKASVPASSAPSSIAPTPPLPSADDLVDVFDHAKSAWKKVRARDVPFYVPFAYADHVVRWGGSLDVIEWLDLKPADLTKPQIAKSSEDEDEGARGPDGIAHRKDDNRVDFDLSAGKGEHKIWLRLPRTQQVNVLASGDLSHPEWAIATVAELKSGDRVQMATGEIGLVTGNETTADQSVPPGVNLVIGKSERLTDTLLEVRTTGSLVTTTPTHPFKVQSKGWVEAQKLQPGDALFGGAEGKRVEVISAALRKVNPPQKVYNLDAWPTHIYLVGAEGLQVHNGQCIPKPSPADVKTAEGGGRRFIVDRKGNTMIEPPGGSTVGNKAGTFVETRYPNGSPAQQLHGPHRDVPQPHGHGFEPGQGLNERGPSLDPTGKTVPVNSPEAHWPVNQ